MHMLINNPCYLDQIEKVVKYFIETDDLYLYDIAEELNEEMKHMYRKDYYHSCEHLHLYNADLIAFAARIITISKYYNVKDNPAKLYLTDFSQIFKKVKLNFGQLKKETKIEIIDEIVKNKSDYVSYTSKYGEPKVMKGIGKKLEREPSFIFDLFDWLQIEDTDMLLVVYKSTAYMSTKQYIRESIYSLSVYLANDMRNNFEKYFSFFEDVSTDKDAFVFGIVEHF